MITMHGQYCPLPAFMHGMKCKMMVIDADTSAEAEQAEVTAKTKGWLNYMGGIATDEETGKPGLVPVVIKFRRDFKYGISAFSRH